MDEQEQRGREYLADIVGESVPRATWPDGLRAQLEEFLAAAPGLLPPTHPKGPRSMDHMPWRGRHPDVVLFEDPDLVGKPSTVTVAFDPSPPDPQPPAVVIRYAPEVAAEMRRRYGKHWPAEPPMVDHGWRERVLAAEARVDESLRAKNQPRAFGPPWDQPGANAVADLQAFVQNMVPVPTSVLQRFVEHHRQQG